MCDQSKESARKDMRNSVPEWTGMSAQHRQSSQKKPYSRTKKKLLVLDIIKITVLVIVLLVVGKWLYDMRQDCIKQFGDGIMCID